MLLRATDRALDAHFYQSVLLAIYYLSLSPLRAAAAAAAARRRKALASSRAFSAFTTRSLRLDVGEPVPVDKG